MRRRATRWMILRPTTCIASSRASPDFMARSSRHRAGSRGRHAGTIGGGWAMETNKDERLEQAVATLNELIELMQRLRAARYRAVPRDGEAAAAARLQRDHRRRIPRAVRLRSRTAALRAARRAPRAAQPSAPRRRSARDAPRLAMPAGRARAACAAADAPRLRSRHVIFASTSGDGDMAPHHEDHRVSARGAGACSACSTRSGSRSICRPKKPHRDRPRAISTAMASWIVLVSAYLEALVRDRLVFSRHAGRSSLR